MEGTPCKILLRSDSNDRSKNLEGGLGFDPNTQEEGEVLEVNLDHAQSQVECWMIQVLKKAFDETQLTLGKRTTMNWPLDLGELLQLKRLLSLVPNGKPDIQVDLFRIMSFKFPLMENLEKLFPQENSPNICQ